MKDNLLMDFQRTAIINFQNVFLGQFVFDHYWLEHGFFTKDPRLGLLARQIGVKTNHNTAFVIKD